ncbi:MAG: glutamine amidotransferase [Candidatus Omnitrophica bacterium]|nr:glutamine amidotransferase [Candidatus Omnitrophota bacterium]
MDFNKKIIFLLLIFLSCSFSLFAASVKIITGRNGEKLIIMQNNLLRLQIDPNHGARVEGFQYKPWGKINIIQDKNGQGLLADHFWQESWPGQFWNAKYNYKILSRGPAEVSVGFSCLSQNNGIPQVAGILLEKTITLKENDRVIMVTISLTNKTSTGKYVGYWLQNVCWLGGEKPDNYYFRPGKTGINITSSNEANPPDGGFLRHPQAGWLAGIDKKTKTGLIFFMNYNELWFLYNCTAASTIEWQYQAVVISPGRTWRTHITIVPVSEVKSLSGNSIKKVVQSLSVYSIKSQKKFTLVLRPEKIIRIIKPQPHVLFLKGLFSPQYHIGEVLKQVSSSVKIKEGYVYDSVFGSHLDYFPYNYDELMSYNLVIIGDVSAESLGNAGMEMLKDYCKYGGNILVLGGPCAYGDGGYQNTILNRILPVISQRPFDLRRSKKHEKIILSPKIRDMFSNKIPEPQYIHDVTVKPGAEVLMRYGSLPVIVSGHYGEGRIFCITAPPMGRHNIYKNAQWHKILVYLLKQAGI